MNEKDTLHLWFKPYSGVMTDGDVALVERYGKCFYPKTMCVLAKHLHRTIGKITRLCEPNAFEYQMMHFTQAANKRYVIQESLREVTDTNGLNIAIQPTTAEERKKFTKLLDKNQLGTVTNVVAYLENSLEMEGHLWENAKLKGGAEAIPILKELITFLKNIRAFASVATFEVSNTENGLVLTLALLSPSVITYHTRIDWVLG